jgi:alkylated DNA nucleotide flippase Atl1
VINAIGKVSPHGFGMGTHIQRTLLEDEGIIFDLEGVVDFEKFGWDGV